MNVRLATIVVFIFCVLSIHARGALADYFAITVIDEQTGRGVPLVELEAVNHAIWWTDSNGIVAFDEPGLMNEGEVYFHVRSHGYEYPKDMFGFRGVKLKPARGGKAIIKIKRLNIAERLYRITGEGIYRDSILVGHPAPTQRPLLNGQVLGQDTVIATPYREKIYWFWGDTDRASYPLGNFGASGATSELPGHGGLNPVDGVDLTYFVDTAGFSKPMCPLPGSGLRWIEGLLTVPDDKGVDRLVARVANVRDLGHVNDWHLMLFDDQKEVFESVQRWDIHEGHDSAHPFRARVDDVEYYYLYPNWRVKADLKSLYDLKNYEALTCVAGEGKLRGKETELDRDAAGRPRYSWKPGADRLSAGQVRELVSAGKLKPEESWINLHDFATGEAIEAGRGSVCWNEFRRRWAMIVSAQAGEIWFAEGDTPVGPWAYARRVLAHDEYNFYNPTQHPFFDQDGGRLIYFEGTYTASFSGAKEKTPRYDYNQIMYRLALDDPRLGLPAPVYRVRNTDGKARYLMREGVDAERAWRSIQDVAFFAVPPKHRRGGLTPIFVTYRDNNAMLQAGPSNRTGEGLDPVFFALPTTNSASPQTISGPWQCKVRTADGNEFEFALELTQHEATVEAVSQASGISGEGSFQRGQLLLRLTRDNHAYSFNATLHERKLTGEWRQSDGELRGTWSADWIDPMPSEDTSRAVVALYEYQRADGERVYSTAPNLDDTELKRAAEPLCRVWKNPMAVLVLDIQARPSPPGKR